MTNFLSSLAPGIIKWPTQYEINRAKQYFLNKNGFPEIVGIIDGTHIKIDKPEDDPLSYTNRKGYYSIQTQLICDQDLKIISMFTGYDAKVFRTLPIFQTLEQRCGADHILG
ncbi:unnamed protein product [Acanthoscelides obtectus]|uniref:DDE Tnp4 domain-containing protein n=1 Tax=Acanthoscelides obtectus TaxID=200917 RepID=A0A9P0KMG8_ACAOB|nr:unnamed protein product [Acanthoscelides obtectus]CAK1667585.1 Putative nuclease HARBI1 [Acanthoscelides obtectus]